ncbi:ABC transporter substrate-binding protein (plasmid) [Sinorhizobium medicae]|uniref:ABC transporter substrate-binding protein n=1 Tax=Sinorhizobium medicae TaxID=110321 RepID=UPI002AF6A57C|nr:ABC transporter substrate-binding protein [Sinorhizobium medicae]WQO62272.1 ABC transporter substrate-binding protein [Sinorhizobium medicae]
MGTGAAALELKITYSPANFSGMYQELASRFMERHPDVRIKLAGFPTYAALSENTLRSAITGGLPDVSFEGINFVRRYADRQLAIPLNDRMTRDAEWQGQELPVSIQDIGTVNGDIVAVPFAISTMNVFYNADLVRQAGGDPSNLPTNWDEIVGLAEQIDALSGDISGMYFDYGAGSALAFQSLVFSQGGSMMDESETQVAFADQEGSWAMDLVRRFGEAGQLNMSRDQARQMFVAGKLGIYQNTSSNMGNFDQQISGTFEYVVGPVPVVEGGRSPAAGNAMVVFSSEPEQQEAAWDWVKFATSPEAQSIMAMMTGYVPVNARAADTPQMRAFYETHPNHAVPLSQIDTLTAWYAFPGENGERVAEDIVDAMERVVNLRQSPDDALNEVAARARRLLGLD